VGGSQTDGRDLGPAAGTQTPVTDLASWVIARTSLGLVMGYSDALPASACNIVT